MSYYMVQIEGGKVTHASPLPNGHVLYCAPGRKVRRGVTVVKDKPLTCGVCRSILTKQWRSMITGDDVNNYVYYFQGSHGPAIMYNIELVTNNEVGVWASVDLQKQGEIQFYTAVVENANVVSAQAYRLDVLLKILVDGNAFTVERAAQEGEPQES